MSGRTGVAAFTLAVLAFFLETSTFAQAPEAPSRRAGSWYRHPQGVYRVPVPDGWEVLSGVRGTVQDEQFDTLIDPTRQYSILCWRGAEKVADAMAALEKYREEKLAELASYRDVHAAGLSINRVPMMRITYQLSADRMVSRISLVKNGQRVVINTVSPLGQAAGQLPLLVDDLIGRIEFPDRGVPLETPPVETPPVVDRPATVRDPLASVPPSMPPASVLEKQEARVNQHGGELTLQGGLRLVVPPGAVTGETAVSVERLDPSVFNGVENAKYVVLNCSASVPRFERAVEIRLPLGFPVPAGTPPPLAGTLNDETGLLELRPTRFEANGAGAELVMTTDHFCVVVVSSGNEVRDWVESPPASSPPLETPIYKQGKTPFCWAMTMHTQARAYASGTNSAYNVLGDVGLNFIGSAGMRWRPSINNWFQGHAGQPPTRLYWGVSKLSGSDFWLDTLKRHIRREVGKHQRPVYLGKDLWSGGHSWLVVGYDDQENFIVQDPQDPPDIPAAPDAMGYYKASASDLGLNWGIPGDSFVTITIPRPLNAQRSLVSLNIPHRAIWFTDPTVPNAFIFGWTHASPEGYEWRKAKQFYHSGEAFDGPLPPTIEELQLGSAARSDTGFEIINGSLSETKHVTLEIELGEDGGEVRYQEQQSHSIGPNCRKSVTSTIPLQEFRRPEDRDLTRYRCNATLREGDAEADRASFAFEIGPGQWFDMEVTNEQRRQEPPFATSMVPNRILWCEPARPDAPEVQLTLNYISQVAGRAPLSAAGWPGVSSKITLRAQREGSEYVLRGPHLDEIARQAEFCRRYMVVALLTAVVDVASEFELDEASRRKKAENEARRKHAENMEIAVENVEFRLRQVGDTLRLTLRGKVQSTIPQEAPMVSEADVEVVGTAEK